jgi:hypothetical protein
VVLRWSCGGLEVAKVTRRYACACLSEVACMCVYVCFVCLCVVVRLDWCGFGGLEVVLKWSFA